VVKIGWLKGSKRPVYRPEKLYTFRVDIVRGPIKDEFWEANPVMARVIRMRGKQTLEELHWAIYDAFNRDEEDHLYEFTFPMKRRDRNPIRYGPPPGGMFSGFTGLDGAGHSDRKTLDGLDLHPRQVFYYEFDFGDGWQHKIKVVSIRNEVPDEKYPVVVERIGESPPQYADWDEDEYEGEEGEDEEEEGDGPDENKEGASENGEETNAGK